MDFDCPEAYSAIDFCASPIGKLLQLLLCGSTNLESTWASSSNLRILCSTRECTGLILPLRLNSEPGYKFSS